MSRGRLTARAALASILRSGALNRWMAVVLELRSRRMISDVQGEYLRAVRPYVHRRTSIDERVLQLITHADWIETAFQRAALEWMTSGKAVTLMDLPPARGFDYVRLQLHQSPPQSPEGELMLSLVVQRSPDIQVNTVPVELAALAFSCFRVDGKGCFVIGGVRGQRDPVQRLSAQEVAQALQGWKPSVLMVRFAQELARHWGLYLIGLDPSAHRLQGWSYQRNARQRDAAQRIYASYDALWEHFKATPGPAGWVVLPLNSDEKLEATALSPEKRARQVRRADYWIRVRKQLRQELPRLLVRPGGKDPRISRITQAMSLDPLGSDEAWEDRVFDDSEEAVPSRVLETGPGSLD